MARASTLAAGAGGTSTLKTLARRRLRAARRALSGPARACAQQAVCARLPALAPRPALVAAYAPAGSELDVSQALAAWEARGVPLAFPRVSGPDLVWCLSSLASLVVGYRGIREPPRSAPVVSLADAALVLVPGLGFTRRGARLGQGGGFYDRALAQLSAAGAPSLGVAFAAQVAPRLPTDSHDYPVDRVLTERGLASEGTWGGPPQLPMREPAGGRHLGASDPVVTL